MDKKIRIGVMGCADIAQRLVIPAIQQLGEKFKLVGVASRTADKARSFADRFACESIEGHNTLVLRDDLDAVYIPLPTGLHKEWIIKALEHGKHVYAEKSIAMNGIDAEDMVTCAKLNRVALMEGYMFQYHKQHQVVKDLLKSNVIGEMRLIRASFGFPPFSDLANFRYDNKIGGGALKDVASYLVWLDCRELELSQKDLNEFFVDKAHLALNDGEMFGKEGIGFMRLNVASPRCIIEKAMKQLADAYQLYIK